MDQVRKDEVRETLGQDAVVNIVQRRQKRWNDILAEMDDEQLVKKVHEGEVGGKRPRGRPRKS